MGSDLVFQSSIRRACWVELLDDLSIGRSRRRMLLLSISHRHGAFEFDDFPLRG